MREGLRRLFQGGEPPTGSGVWVASTVLLVVVVAVVYPVTRLLDQAVIGSSSGVYLELAANDVWCGRYPYSTALDPANAKVIDLTNVVVADVASRGIKHLVIERAGSLERYCAMTGTPLVMNEISFAALESVLLRIHPGITFAGLGQSLAWLRVGLIVIFGLCLIRVGQSLLFVGAVTLAALYLNVLIGGNALFSQYPFFVPAMVGGIGVAAVSLSYGWHRRPLPGLATSMALGVWTLFVGNLRTSLFPEAIAVSALFLWFAWRDQREQPLLARLRWRWLAVAAGAWFIGALAFDTVYVRPVRNLPAMRNSSAHGIAHPLVLGLASPANALAQREGIVWNDAVGPILAKRIDPTVQFLDDRYEPTLFTYYRKLWADHPGEMAAIYVQKFAATTPTILQFLRSSTASVFWSAKDGYWLGLMVWPMAILSTVVPIPLVFGGLIASGWIGWRKRDPGRTFILAAVGIVGVLTFAETAIILGGVVLWYSSVLLCCTIFASCLTYQWLLDLTWSASTAMTKALPSIRATARRLSQVLSRVITWTARQLLQQRSRPGLVRAGLHFAIVAVSVVLLAPRWVEIERTPTIDQDAIARLAAAVSRANCGVPAATAAANRVVAAGVADVDAIILPIRTLIASEAGSVEALCASSPEPRPFSPSILLAMETSILLMRPGISFAGLAKALHYARVAAVLAFVAQLTVAGAGILLGIAAGLAGLWVLVVMKGALFSVAPFGPVLLFQSVGFFAVAMRYQWAQTHGRIVAFAAAGWCVIVGLLCREYLPMQMALIAILFVLHRILTRRSFHVRH